MNKSTHEMRLINNLKLYNYLEFLFTEIPKHMEDNNLDFLETFIPWSGNFPIECKKNKLAKKADILGQLYLTN